MKKIICIFILFSFSRQVLGQMNFVPNPSFEDTVGACVNSLSGGTTDMVKKARYWKNFSMSADYFNACATPSTVSVPYNVFGFQNAATGNAYSGFLACHDSTSATDAREILGVQLTQTLSIGQKYFVSFNVVRTEAQGGHCWACNKIGVKFTTFDANYPDTQQNNPLANNFSQVYSTTIITDSINWTTVKGSFVADSVYKYVLIGNFFKDNQTQYSTCPNTLAGYFFVDDVCVSTDSNYCNLWTKIYEQNINRTLLIYPNPTSGNVNIKFPDQSIIHKLIVTNHYGQIIFQKTNFDGSLDLNNISDGLYFIQILSDGKSYYDKIIVRH